jgi:hypothetical protein
MATTRETPDIPGGSVPRPPAPPPPPVNEPKPLLTTPIVIDLRGGKKKRGRRKKRYTRGTKAIQRALFGSSKAGWRVTNAVSRGLNTFVRRSNRSRGRRKDGMLRDSLRNASRGFGRAASEFGRAPYDVASRISTKRVRRTFRFFLPAYR